MQPVLVMFRKDGVKRSFSISKPAVTIGRREDCDLRIPIGEVSRKHCRLTQGDNALRVEDLGSSNGTFVNGKRVQDGTIEAGQTLQVGPISFVLQINGQPPEDELVLHKQETASASGEFDPSELLLDPEDSGIHDIPGDMTIDLETKTRLSND